MTQEEVLIIAEAGVNHNGSLSQAKKLIEVAHEAGADIVKFQTFKASALATSDAPQAAYQARNTGNTESQLQMLQKLELSHDDFRELKAHCDRVGIRFLSTPFDEESADFLVRDLQIPYLKIPSGEAVNIPYLRHLAGLKKPIILSTGMCTLDEIRQSVDCLRRADPSVALTLLHCTTNYPCPLNEVNLRAMITMRDEFKLPVGYSDHTLGLEAPLAAVALGARIIEKHFTLDRSLPGPDQRSSLEPEELKQMVRSIRGVQAALGSPEKAPTPSERQIMLQARKSLVAARALDEGHRINEADLRIKRPGTGISPLEYDKVLGRTLQRPLRTDETLQWEDLKD